MRQLLEEGPLDGRPLDGGSILSGDSLRPETSVALIKEPFTEGEAVLYRRLEGLEVQVASLRPVEGESVRIILLRHNHQ